MDEEFEDYEDPFVDQKPLPISNTPSDTSHLIKLVNDVDSRMGFNQYFEGPPKLGWLSAVNDEIDTLGRSAVDLYFLEEDGDSFKATDGYEPDVEEYLKKKFKNNITSISTKSMDDLSLPNHLVGRKRLVLKLCFANETQMQATKKILMPIINNNSKRNKLNEDFEFTQDNHKLKTVSNPEELMLDLREHDIMYYARVAIDCELRVGCWYDCKAIGGKISLSIRSDKVSRADPVVLAFDIETTKLPLKFPDSTIDSIMMISYMIDGEGYLIVNREVVSKDISDFSFNPKPEYSGTFAVFNEPNERSLICKFFEHIELARPTVIVTYNGDFFDWPFLEARANAHGISMSAAIGFSAKSSGEYLSTYAAHLDCFYWVKRDIATYKLGYNPIELDPEDMTRFASEKPQVLAQYSVSDAIATYYLYMKYVHPFIFSLCNIIPLNPDDVEAAKANILMPNKHSALSESFLDGRLLNSETYVGGHVEALEAGVFRSDIATKFTIDPDSVQKLIEEIDNALKFSIIVENHCNLSDVTNYESVKSDIITALESLILNPTRQENPAIYHLDVAAMYPNIILTNRLQPDAVIDDSTCATCDYNIGLESSCQKRMTWSWRGEFSMVKKGEYNMIRNQLEHERFNVKGSSTRMCGFLDLPKSEQLNILKKRVNDYSRKVYGKIQESKVIERESIVCQRENPFYVNTVRAFRDRRYEYKGLLKVWKGKLEGAFSENDIPAIDEAKKMIVIYDSLQLAHKCILNSFYGYVMRKGARWYSMEMAGIVCLTGAKIIQLARSRIDKLGRPLELDTDGIWCMLPGSFPANFTFSLKNGKKIQISYPCVMLNHLVHDQFTNHQYEELDEEKKTYSIRSENSIFFEVDGPYRAMILPSSTEEDKLLKKRYAVFNFDGSLAELKGFEVKRRGELKMIKNFQSSIFKVFLEGESLKECYNSVAKVANQWLDILRSKAVDLTDEQLFDLISENKSMSKALQDYGSQKSTAITTAKRLAEFLGNQMVRDKGLNCRFIIACKPHDVNVSERAIPVAIFQSDPGVKNTFLRKWLRDSSTDTANIRDIIDWKYYTERFESVIQKLITIPAAMQNIDNPLPSVRHPDWLIKKIMNRDDKNGQTKIIDFFVKKDKDLTEKPVIDDNIIEDCPQIKPVITQTSAVSGKRRVGTPLPKRKKKRSAVTIKIPPGIIDPFTDYVGWLEQKKILWSEKLNHSFFSRMIQSEGVKSYFAPRSQLLVDNPLEIIQISSTESPGIFRLWMMLDNSMQSILISVPRILFLNTQLNVEHMLNSDFINTTKLSRTLPRSRKVYNLYQMDMDENFYRENSSLFSSLANHKDVEGIYESQVSLLFRALLHIRCFGKINRTLKSSSKNHIAFNDIENISRSNYMYLQDTEFDLIHLYMVKSGSNQVWSLFSHGKSLLFVFVVDQGQNKDAIPGIKKIYSEAWSAKENADELRCPRDIKIELTLSSNEKGVIKAINKLLESEKNSIRKPSILGIQTIGDTQQLRSMGLTSIANFPTLNIPSHKTDSKFPTISWQNYALKRMVAHLLNFEEFLNERIELSRYADVPFCNIENDYPLFLSDLFLARKLVKANCLLWCSPSSKPDLGGSEQDDNRMLSLEKDCYEYNFPGKYDSICVEMDLWDLALNTLIQYMGSNSEWNNNIVVAATKHNRTVDDLLTDDSKNGKLQSFEPESLHTVILTIRMLVKGWLDEVNRQNRFASHLLEHFHRWITSSNALLFDPLITSHIHDLMKRCFVGLLEEFKKLGSSVVYASFSKIVLSTPKADFRIANGYLSYLIMGINKNINFQHLELKPTAFWRYLLWMDLYNYGGVCFSEIQEKPTDEGPATIVDMKWNISQYLPPVVRNYFLQIIAAFLYTVQNGLDKPKETYDNYLMASFESEIKRELFNIIQSLFAAGNSSSKDKSFPTLPGSCKEMHNPPLELIKMVTNVLQMEKILQRDVQVMKRDLLSIIEVREFSSSAIFENPCEKYVIPQFICEYCNYSCDLDLTRQHDISDNDQNLNLHCVGCLMAYDTEIIEQRLLEDLNRLLINWQLQDLACSKCKLVDVEDMRKHCVNCNGKLNPSLDFDLCIRKIKVLRNISNFFQMDVLNEVIGQII